MSYWKILYTTEKHKKQVKKWIDGFMHVKPDGRNAVMYNEDLDKIHHFKIERKHRIFEGGEFGIQKYDLQIDEQIAKLPTDLDSTSGPSEFYSPPPLIHRSRATINNSFRKPAASDSQEKPVYRHVDTPIRMLRKRKSSQNDMPLQPIKPPRFAPSIGDCFDEKDTIDIKLESPESQTFSEPAKIAKLSTAECSSSNVLDDTNKLSEKSDFSFSLTENSEDNHSLPLFNSQGDIHSRLMKSNPACTSHIPEDHQTSSQEHCSEVSHGRASTFKNPFDSSDED
ncbi:unnamed protein product [Oikopleura dioica]|uniref:5'-3' DNA helicase ZGRF1-like N-terminal domain-containing protein n=1 Tax=Oikopleura dioica TaxID=34765 RepID=E4X706_OIKDI|nr:unnamed protein product [Oikopleura dioica]